MTGLYRPIEWHRERLEKLKNDPQVLCDTNRLRSLHNYELMIQKAIAKGEEKFISPAV